jgi:pimeloyl-ACP methyl ester carboxylesterase
LAHLLAVTREPGPVYLYGVSYGTQLALRLLALKQPHLTGIILDSLTPPETSDAWDLSHRSQVADQVGRAVLSRCDETPVCRSRFPAGAAQAYSALLASKERPAFMPPGDLKVFFGGLLDFPETRARIPDLIVELPLGQTRALDAVEASLGEIGAALSRYPQSPWSA